METMEELVEELGSLLNRERRLLEADTVDLEAASQNLNRIEELFQLLPLNPGNAEFINAGKGEREERLSEKLREISRLRRENTDILRSIAKDMGKQIKMIRKSGKALLAYANHKP